MFSNGVCGPEVLAGDESNFENETHFFDQDENYQQGIGVYSRRFEHCGAHGGSDFILDATPNTLLHTKRVHETYAQVGTEVLSKVKLIVILREPVSRELSLYNQKKAEYLNKQRSLLWYNDIAFANNHTVMSFEEYSKRVLAGRLSNQLWRPVGKYVDHLKQWMLYFEREQLLVLSYDEVLDAPDMAQWRIRKFLGTEFSGALRHEHAAGEGDEVRAVPVMARQTLDSIFKEKNLELYEFLDQHPGPSMEEYPFPRFTNDLPSESKYAYV